MESAELAPAKFTVTVQDALRQADERLEKKTKEDFKYTHGAEPGTKQFAKLVDHTILKPETTEDAVRKICDEAKQWSFKTVCVQPHHVSFSSKYLAGTDVAVCSVVCFPQGTQTAEEKINEAKSALRDGAAELDFVINHAQLKAQAFAAVHSELCAIAAAVKHPQSGAQEPTIKLILETSQLERQDIVAGCLLASKAGFDFVKTSTGFLGHGARVEEVRLMREMCEMEGGRMKVKASGGIRTARDARAMLDAGAGRLGLSGSVAIMEEGVGKGNAVANGASGDGY